MIIKDDTTFRLILCAKGYSDPEKNIDFPFIENEYIWEELKETGHPLCGLVQQVLEEEKEKIILEAEKKANKFILEKN